MRKATLAIVLLSISASPASAAEDNAERARALVGQSRGLIVHLGCGDAELTAALRVDDSCLVHGIDRDASKIAKARARVRARGLYGSVSVEVWDEPFLPYVDNTVNLLLAEDADEITTAEMLRVLAPGGTLRRRQDDQWTKTTKPADERTDEWSHYRHDASGNAVAHDTVVGPPRHLQWTAGPGSLRLHEFTPGLSSLVTAGGRLFYVHDEGSIRTIRAPSSWQLVARDAYNGLLLWTRPLPDWFAKLVLWTQVPRQLNRKIVADAERLYVTLGFHAPLSALDAATGKTLLEFPNSAGAEEIISSEGVVIAVVGEPTPARVAAYRKLLDLSAQAETPLAQRETRQPLTTEFRSVENKTPRSLVAFDARSGKELWRLGGAATGGIEPLTLCSYGGRVFFQRTGRKADRRRGHDGREVVALDLKTGASVWTLRAASVRFACEAGVVCRSNDRVALLSREDGRIVWNEPVGLVSVRDTFVANGALWIGGFKPFDTGTRWTGPAWGPYFAVEHDLATGAVRREVTTRNPGHHQRCYDSAATDRYILTGRRGTEFIDLDSGGVSYHSWARGTCRYGVMPANGLLYVPPHECGCYTVAKLIGFNALAASRSYPSGGSTSPRLRRGPAFGEVRGTATADDWSTFRGDASRSGSTSVVLPHDLRASWTIAVGTPLTAPTAAGGRVFVAATDRHEVLALDLASGAEVWRFTADGPVDSPPTVHDGQVLFGGRDGHVYAVRATDGALTWRLRATADPRRLVAHGRLESTLPVPGSVLIADGVLWCTAGRSSFLDGGIDLLRLDPSSGEVLSRRRIYSPAAETGAQVDPLERRVIRGSRMDILSADGGKVFLQDRAFSTSGEPLPERSRHLFALTGFLDDEWVHRSYWVYGEIAAAKLGSGGDRMQDVVFGRLLSVDAGVVYGYGRKRIDWSNEFNDGAYRLFARDKDSRQKTFRWERPSRVRVRALVVTGDALYAAGLPNEATDGPARLLSFSKADGEPLADLPLPAEPVLNGMAIAGGRLVVTLESGEVACFGSVAK